MQAHEIKEKREAAGLSQQELGERVGLSKGSARALISAYETGNSRNKPTGARMDLIRKALVVAARIKKDTENQWRTFRENNSLD